LNKSQDPTIAVTGELIIISKVLRIGGFHENIVAARQAGSKLIIFPYDNLSDWLEFPEVATVPYIITGSDIAIKYQGRN